MINTSLDFLKMKPTLLRFPLLFAISTLLTLTIGCKKENVMPPGASVSTGPVQYETPFAEIPGTADIVMYEINERAFSTSGDLAGIIPRLDSIRALGVNVIWLMPIHPNRRLQVRCSGLRPLFLLEASH